MTGGRESSKVGIDARSLRGGPLGVATYVRNLLERLPELDPFAGDFPKNNLLYSLWRLPAAQLRRRWALFHAPGYTAPPWNHCPVVLTVHDLSYLVNEAYYPHPVGQLRRGFYRRSLSIADRILAPTDFTKKEIAERFPRLADKIRTTHLGVSAFFRRDEAAAEAARRQLSLPAEFLLHVGDIHARRNVGEIAAAARTLNLPLVLVGRVLPGGDEFKEWPLRFQGVSAETLKGIYSAASLLVCASEYEGFGLPVVEAMACGLPVVAANRSCLPEVCSDAALLTEPRAGSIAEAARAVLEDPRPWIAKGLLRARHFDWDKTASATRRVYRELMG